MKRTDKEETDYWDRAYGERKCTCQQDGACKNEAVVEYRSGGNIQGRRCRAHDNMFGYEEKRWWDEDVKEYLPKLKPPTPVEKKHDELKKQTDDVHEVVVRNIQTLHKHGKKIESHSESLQNLEKQVVSHENTLVNLGGDIEGLKKRLDDAIVNGADLREKQDERTSEIDARLQRVEVVRGMRQDNFLEAIVDKNTSYICKIRDTLKNAPMRSTERIGALETKVHNVNACLLNYKDKTDLRIEALEIHLQESDKNALQNTEITDKLLNMVEELQGDVYGVKGDQDLQASKIDTIRKYYEDRATRLESTLEKRIAKLEETQARLENNDTVDRRITEQASIERSEIFGRLFRVEQGEEKKEKNSKWECSKSHDYKKLQSTSSYAFIFCTQCGNIKKTTL